MSIAQRVSARRRHLIAGLIASQSVNEDSPNDGVSDLNVDVNAVLPNEPADLGGRDLTAGINISADSIDTDDNKE
jgi:hypothetical protein